MRKQKNLDIQLIIIDLFSGAGGVSTGFESTPRCKVIAAINHDEMAIASHAANHPNTHHFVEDIRSIAMAKLVSIVNVAQSDYPNAKVLLWASLECTNFSKAKGGLPRDGDSRSLADYLPWYTESLKPDYIGIENVIEFMSWGPLNEHGKPISKDAGCDYLNWVERMKVINNGYSYSWRELNSADFGAYTSRKRFFAWFAHDGLPIIWPTPTHSKNPAKSSLFSSLQKWKPVREVLDLKNKGKSIFGRKKPLSEKTLERIYAGLIKFVAGGKDEFMVKYNSMNKNGKYIPPSLDEPCPVISTQGRLAICHTAFLASYYGNGDNVGGTDKPAGTITTKDRISLVQPQFIHSSYTSGGFHSSIECPIGSLLANPKQNLVTVDPFVMDTNFINKPTSINEPSRTITANRKWHYLINPQWFNSIPGSIDLPGPTLIARMDKAPPYIVEVESGVYAIEVYTIDSNMTIKIKEFMALYGIADIYMRMLTIPELMKIQGFPDGYILKGTQTQQKKYIGNSVVPLVIKAMATALIESFSTNKKTA